jgi:hypothetical protein
MTAIYFSFETSLIVSFRQTCTNTKINIWSTNLETRSPFFNRHPAGQVSNKTTGFAIQESSVIEEAAA